ncbi:hypothetical protein KR026_003280, partial [Drosophila bipectinata]
LPTQDYFSTCTYADDTAFVCSADSRVTASQELQHVFNDLQPWLKRWNIVINADKSTHITFSLRPGNCPPVSLNGSIIPHKSSAKYLGMTLDRRLTWKTHIDEKDKLIRHKARSMSWLLSRKSKLSTKNKVLLYKTIIKPACT